MIDFNKITKIRKEKGLSVLGLCNLIGINRSTLWAWKNRGTLPSEDKIRKTAEILGVSVETISDLKEEKEISDYNLIERSAGIGNYLHGSDSKKVINKFNELHSSISGLENDLSELTIIINALLKSLDILIYVKDKNLKYITASESFLKNLNLNNNYNVTGKIDEDLFSSKEAKINHEQDKIVIKSGIAVMEEETYIPGSRKKKWSIVSKYPLFDSQNRVIGLIGTFTDITNRKKDEERRVLLEKVMNVLPPISIMNYDHSRFVYGNKEAKIEIKEAFDTPFYEYKINPMDGIKYIYPEDLEHLLQKNNSNFPCRNSFRVIQKDGTLKWCDATHYIAEYKDRNYIFSVGRFCEEEKQIENENTIFKRIINKLSENSKNIIWAITATKNKGLKLSFLNRNFEKATGYSSLEFIEGEKNIESIIPIEYQHIFSDNYDKNREIKFQLITSQNKNINLTTSVNKELFPGLDDIYYGEAIVE